MTDRAAITVAILSACAIGIVFGLMFGWIIWGGQPT